MKLAGVWSELRRRRVPRAVVLYIGAVWALSQGISQLTPALGLPAMAARWLLIACALGFPFWLAFAWYYAFTPEGIRRESEIEPDQRRDPSMVRKLDFAIIGVLAFAVVLLATQLLLRVPARAAAVPAKSIAVLPLSALGGGDAHDYLGKGISDELVNALSRIPGLEVIGRTSSFRFATSNLGAREIRRQLGARNLLSGVVQRDGEAYRVDVELDDTVTGARIWSARYDENTGDLFALEDRISDAVVAALKVRLGNVARGKLVVAGTASPQAHDLYLQGVRLSWHTDDASLERALALFQQALAIDPDYAAAWAGMARTYVNLADVDRAPLSVLPAMRSAAQKAVALDPDLAEGHLQLGYLAMSYDLDFAQARRELALAVKLQPSLAEAHAMLGLYRLRIDRDPAAARKQLEVAEKLDPLNPWYPRWEAHAAVAQGNEADAMRLAERVHRIDPAFAYNGDTVALVDGAFGHWRACVGRYARQHARQSLASPQLAVCQAHAGDGTAARATARQLEAEARTRYVDPTYIAAIYAALDEPDRALAQLDAGLRDHSAHMNSIWMNPWYRPLHDDPRFGALVARIRAKGDRRPAAAVVSDARGPRSGG